MDSANPLFSATKITGSFQIAARLRDSWNVPCSAAPSPKKHTQTVLVPCNLADSAAPQARGGPPPTIPLAPSMPLLTSAMCILPPLPLQSPVALPKISAIIPFTSHPLAMQCPCPLCVLVMVSPSFRDAHTPVATASSPAYKCTNPGIRPRANSSLTRVSKSRIVTIVSYSFITVSRSMFIGYSCTYYVHNQATTARSLTLSPTRYEDVKRKRDNALILSILRKIRCL